LLVYQASPYPTIPPTIPKYSFKSRRTKIKTNQIPKTPKEKKRGWEGVAQ
jgi:hypothetical protein